MFKPSQLHKNLTHQTIPCAKSFTLLAWNVAKLSLNEEYKTYIQKLIREENIDLLLLQEVKKERQTELDLSEFSHVFSPNIQTKKYSYGVLSAFKISCCEEEFLLTKKQEVLYATHKVSLITKHQTCMDTFLLIVNLHAINFVHNKNFEEELQLIQSKIKKHEGPLIVAGDFNTWNRKRLKALDDFMQALALKKVRFPDEQHLKKVFSKTLDYILYRDLELSYSKVLNSEKISDHNPILASFNLVP
jgi:endonuclease/exonuclease/phosphatase (EEP) superfamily protein YafD